MAGGDKGQMARVWCEDFGKILIDQEKHLFQQPQGPRNTAGGMMCQSQALVETVDR